MNRKNELEVVLGLKAKILSSNKRYKSKCCNANIQLGHPDGEKWECSECEKLCEYKYE